MRAIEKSQEPGPDEVMLRYRRAEKRFVFGSELRIKGNAEEIRTEEKGYLKAMPYDQYPPINISNAG